jgi:hypothetical protein
MIPTIPSQQYGKNMMFVGLVLCYDATHAGTTLDNVVMIRVNATGIAPFQSLLLEDMTNRDVEECRTYTPMASTTIGPTEHISLQVNVAWSQADAPFRFRRTTMLLTPAP